MSLLQVAETDESPHEVGEELGWGESYAFQFVDPADGFGLSSRIGVRPNEGIMDVGLDTYIPDGGLLAARHVQPQQENTAELSVEGVSYELVRPLQEWKITYDGPAHSLRSSRDAASHDAWHKSRLERLIIDLAFEAEAPAVAVEGLPGRFGQPGRFRGEIWVSGDVYPIDVAGLREKSWGVAASRLPRMRRRFWLRFDDGSAVVIDRRVDEHEDLQSGWWFREGEVQALREVGLSTDPEPDSYWQKSVTLELVDEMGDRGTLSGDMIQLAPLPTVQGSVRLVVCTSVGRFQWGTRSGVGLVEYLHRLDDAGQPELPLAQWG